MDHIFLHPNQNPVPALFSEKCSTIERQLFWLDSTIIAVKMKNILKFLSIYIFIIKCKKQNHDNSR